MSVGYRLRTLPYNPFDSGVSIYDFLMALADTLYRPMTYDICRLGAGAALSLAAIVGCLPGCRSSLAGQQPGPQAPPGEGIAVSGVQKAQADLIAAEHDFMRKSALVSEHAASQALLEQSEDNWRKTKTELERARQKTYLLRTGA